MSSNLPSRGSSQRQGPAGRDVEQAARPGGADPEAQGPQGRSREARSWGRQQPAAMDTSAMDVGDGVRASELGGGAQRTGPSDTERRRLRTQRALRSPRAVRQAILLRELLGPPVALRRHREDPPSLSD